MYISAEGVCIFLRKVCVYFYGRRVYISTDGACIFLWKARVYFYGRRVYISMEGACISRELLYISTQEDFISMETLDY